MLLFITNVICIHLSIRLSDEIFPIEKFKVLFKHDRYSVIYDPDGKHGYMQVSRFGMENIIERLYLCMRGKDLKKFAIGTKYADNKIIDTLSHDDDKYLPISLLDSAILVGHAMKYMMISGEDNKNRELYRIFKMLNLLEVKIEEPFDIQYKVFVYDLEKKVITIRVMDSRTRDGVGMVDYYPPCERYDVGSEEFSNDIENFYRHIYDENGVLLPAKYKCPRSSEYRPLDISKYINHKLHTILSVMGATNMIIQVKDGKKVKYYFRLTPYENVFPPDDPHSLHYRICLASSSPCGGDCVIS